MPSHEQKPKGLWAKGIVKWEVQSCYEERQLVALGIHIIKGVIQGWAALQRMREQVPAPRSLQFKQNRATEAA